jgi:antitoxin component of RelBE/YafQ-DinJ toxin-antitoxin module
MADTITIRTDDETEHALDVLTREGVSRSAAIRHLLDAARAAGLPADSPP